MLIGRDQVVAGVPATRAREVVRHAYHEVETDSLATRVGCTRAEMLALAAALEAEGFLVRETHETANRRSVTWRTTVKGNALAKARIGKPMSRQKAERLLERFLAAVEEINSDPGELFWVDVVRIFGSFTAPDEQLIGDLDLHVIASHRDDYETFDRRGRSLAEGSGRHFNTYLDFLAFPELQLKKRLRCRTPRIDLQLDIGTIRRLPENALPIEIYRRPGTKDSEDGAARRGPEGQVLPWDAPHQDRFTRMQPTIEPRT